MSSDKEVNDDWCESGINDNKVVCSSMKTEDGGELSATPAVCETKDGNEDDECIIFHV